MLEVRLSSMTEAVKVKLIGYVSSHTSGLVGKATAMRRKDADVLRGHKVRMESW